MEQHICAMRKCTNPVEDEGYVTCRECRSQVTYGKEKKGRVHSIEYIQAQMDRLRREALMKRELASRGGQSKLF